MSIYTKNIKRNAVFLTLAVSLFFVAKPSLADTITLKADSWCPYNCEPKSNKPGYMVEVAKEVFSKHGHTVNYEILNWSRAIIQAREGKITGIIGASSGDAREFIFPENALGLMENTYVSLSSNPKDFKDEASLKGSVLGVIRDYAYGSKVDAYIKKHADDGAVNIASGDEALSSLFKKLDKGRIDVLIEGSAVAINKAQELGMADKIKTKLVDANANKAENYMYIAFSPVNPKSKDYAKILSDGIAELRASGRLAEILNKYGMKDWK